MGAQELIDGGGLSPETDRESSTWWHRAGGELIRTAGTYPFFASTRAEPVVKPRVNDALSLLGIDNLGRIAEGTYIGESLRLPASERLGRLAQLGPIASDLLKVDGWTRGQHTEDTMLLTAWILTAVAVTQPELFDRMAGRYPVRASPDEFWGVRDRDAASRLKVIQHFIEFMRLHDVLTLPAHGVTHRMLSYDEDVALLEAVLQGQSAQEKDFYAKHHLDRDVIWRIVSDAINGCQEPALSQVLKGSGRILSLDTIAYTLRDAHNFRRALVDLEAPSPSERIKQLYGGLLDLTQKLAERSKVMLPEKDERIIHPLQIPAEAIQLGYDANSQICFIYDAYFALEVYITHVLLRLYGSGSPWLRGVDATLGKQLENKFGSASRKEVIAILLGMGDKDLIQELEEISPQPDITGWHVVADDNGHPLRYAFKDISQTQVAISGLSPQPLGTVFPEVGGVVKRIIDASKNTPVYLKHKNSG